MNATTTAVQARTATCRLLVTQRDPQTLTYRPLRFLVSAVRGAGDLTETGRPAQNYAGAGPPPWKLGRPSPRQLRMSTQDADASAATTSGWSSPTPPG